MTSQALIPSLVTGGTYWFGDTYAGLSQPRITKAVLHSTETPPPNCPGYSAGASAPTLTVNPWAPLGWQHFLANMSARALVDSANTVVRENRDDVMQIEIIGYADYRINPKYALANIPDSGLKFIADILRFYNQQWGLPLRTSLEWPLFNSPRINQVRLSGPAYDAYQGVLGHMHVSGNDHVDPAGLDITRILELANESTLPPPPPPPSTSKGSDMWLFSNKAGAVIVATSTGAYLVRNTSDLATLEALGTKYGDPDSNNREAYRGMDEGPFSLTIDIHGGLKSYPTAPEPLQDSVKGVGPQDAP